MSLKNICLVLLICLILKLGQEWILHGGKYLDSFTFFEALENIYNFLVEPYAKAVRNDGVDRRLIFTALHETFITYLKVAFFSAMFVNQTKSVFKLLNSQLVYIIVIDKLI